jgi:cytoskeleton protein RodZ
VETEIGPTLREARIRHKVDLTEIEERTKIRVRFLRALETEEWDLLPGPTYTRSFIRTYANFLGLDGERLADDYRRIEEDRMLEHPGGHEPHPIPAQLGGRAGGGPRFSPGVIGGLVAAALVAVIVILGVTGNSSNNSSPGSGGKAANSKRGKHHGGANSKPGVSIQLTATAEVWVCALAADGTRVVNGAILPAGTQEGPFRSGKFDLAFGNGSVDLKVNGKPFQVQNTPSPVGYEVTPNGTRLLQPGTRPNCT